MIQNFAKVMVLALALCLSAASAGYCGAVTGSDGKVIIEDVSTDDIPRLVELLGRNDFVAGQAKQRLVEYGEDSVPVLLEALGTGPGTGKILETLAAIGDARAIGPAAKYINDPAWPVAKAAREVLKNLGDESAPALLGMLKNEKYRDAAVDTLRYIKPSEYSLEELRPMLKSDDAGERSGAAIVAGMWKDKASEGDMLDMTRDPSADVRLAALKGYGYLYSKDPQGCDQNMLLGMLKDPDARVRKQAAQIMTRMDNSAVAEALVDALKAEKDDGVRERLVMCLEETGYPGAVVPMINILQEKDPAPRLLGATIYALGRLNAKEAVPYILEILKGEKGKVARYRIESYLALAELGEPVDMEIFLPYLKPGGHNSGIKELLMMMEKLARPNDTKLIRALEKYMAAETNHIRRKAAQRILDKIR